jgi:hypothetical protein
MVGVKRKHDGSPPQLMRDSSKRILLDHHVRQRESTKAQAVIFPEARDKTVSSLSKDFAQEFHESVLKTTRQQEATRAAHGHGKDIVRTSSSL